MKYRYNLILKALAGFAVAAAMLASCEEPLTPTEPDTEQGGGEGEGEGEGEGGGEVTPPVEVVDPIADSLENALFKQIKALQSVLTDNQVTVASLETKEDSRCLVSLSNGSSFEIVPGNETYTKLLSYTSEGDVMNWSVAGKDGSVSVLKNASGSSIPVDHNMNVEVVDSMVNLTIADYKCVTDFGRDAEVQAFAFVQKLDVEGGFYAAEFILADNKSIILKADGYKEIFFKSEDEDDALESCFVPYGETMTVDLEVEDGVEYSLDITQGWTLSQDGKTISITAPQSAEDMPEVSQLKVLIGESIVVAELSLFFEPFKDVFASAVNAVVYPAGGVGRYAYGLSALSEFSEEAVLEKAAEMLSSGEAASGCALAEGDVMISLETLYGSALAPGQQYVLWAVSDNCVSTCELFGFGQEAEFSGHSAFDAHLEMIVKGAEAIFGGTVVKSDEWMEDALYRVNNSMLDSVVVNPTGYTYSGLASEFPTAETQQSLKQMPGTTYVTWMVPDVDGVYEYTEDDIFFYEYTTNEITSGGSLGLTFGEVNAEPATLSLTISSEGASMIYYAVLSNLKGAVAKDAENSVKFDALCADEYEVVKGSSVKAVCETLNNGTNLEPNKKYWIFAVAVDEQGRYGQVQCVQASTSVLEYDSTIKLSLETIKLTAKSATIKVTSNGGDLSDYIYWAGSMMDPFWTNVMGGRDANAQQYMACHPDDERFNNYGEISEDGTITMTDLKMETEYVFVILEKGEQNYSKAAFIRPVTLAADLGEIVRRGSDRWNADSLSIKIEWHKSAFYQAENSALMSAYGFDFSCPKNLTAYIMCASDGYFEGMGLIKVEYQIIDVEGYCSRSYDSSYTPKVDGEFLCEPDYYKDGELKKGQLMNAYEYYVHGVPSLGSVTYFAEDSHGEENCIFWEGECTGYQTALNKIQRHLTLAPYESRAEAFGLKGEEAKAWAQALYDAYLPFYEGAEPVILINDGSPLTVFNPYATGMNEEGVVPDRVIVVLKDLDGNYYEPMSFEVPNYFK